MNDKRKEYLKKWREDNKEYIRKYKKEYAKTHDSSFKKLQDKCKQLQQENEQLSKKVGNDELISKINLTPETATIQANKVNINGAEQTCDILLKSSVEENKKLKDNWNKLKEYLINDINNRNGNKVTEYEDGRKVSETISPNYTLMEDKSKTMNEVLDKMQELEKGSGSNDSNR